MNLFDDSILKVLAAFKETNLKYIIVGGFATNFHGYRRVTGDIDFWIEDSVENRRTLIRAFDSIGYGHFEELENVDLLPGICEILLDHGIYADFMNTIMNHSPEDFEECFRLSNVIQVENIPIRFLHFNSLLKSKSNSPRLKDQLDYQELLKISEEE